MTLELIRHLVQTMREAVSSPLLLSPHLPQPRPGLSQFWQPDLLFRAASISFRPLAAWYQVTSRPSGSLIWPRL